MVIVTTAVEGSLVVVIVGADVVVVEAVPETKYMLINFSLINA